MSATSIAIYSLSDRIKKSSVYNQNTSSKNITIKNSFRMDRDADDSTEKFKILINILLVDMYLQMIDKGLVSKWAQITSIFHTIARSNR